MNTYEDIYKLSANGNAEALNFLMAWNEYSHRIDDLLDNPEKDYNFFLSILAYANVLYSCPFYQKHVQKLQPMVRQVTSRYADSVRMEKSDKPWEKQWADTLRFCGNDMVEAIAEITGGYELLRKVSTLLKECSWKDHHNELAQPV